MSFDARHQREHERLAAGSTCIGGERMEEGFGYGWEDSNDNDSDDE